MKQLTILVTDEQYLLLSQLSHQGRYGASGRYGATAAKVAEFFIREYLKVLLK